MLAESKKRNRMMQKEVTPATQLQNSALPWNSGAVS